MTAKYGDTSIPGVKVQTTGGSTDGVFERPYPGNLEELYPRIRVMDTGQVRMVPQSDESFLRMEGHAVTFVTSETKFVCSCATCGHRIVLPKRKYKLAREELQTILRQYMAGHFLQVNCDGEASDRAHDEAEKYVGKQSTFENRIGMRRKVQHAIHAVAEEKGRIAHV